MLNSTNSTNLNTKINQEISKSFRNVNYSQWERQSKLPTQTTVKKSVERQSLSSLAIRNRPISTDHSSKQLDNSDRKTFSNPRPGGLGKIVFKSRKQQIEEEARLNLLKTKIKYTKQNITGLKDRASELTDLNLDIIEFIDKTEKTANDSVDKILRKYERYQDVLKTITKKHSEDIDGKNKDLNAIKTESKTELPKYEKVSNGMENELKRAQELNKQLSIYKNQEYPEKVLQITNLRKNLNDLKEFQLAEKESFLQMMQDDRGRETDKQFNLTDNIATKVTEKAVDEMHFSLKEMSLDNDSMKGEIKFFQHLLIDLKDEIKDLGHQVNNLKSERSKIDKTVIFSDVFVDKSKMYCSPDMDIILDLRKKELF